MPKEADNRRKLACTQYIEEVLFGREVQSKIQNFIFADTQGSELPVPPKASTMI
jgi:hypothetical protein